MREAPPPDELGGEGDADGAALRNGSSGRSTGGRPAGARRRWTGAPVLSRRAAERISGPESLAEASPEPGGLVDAVAAPPVLSPGGASWWRGRWPPLLVHLCSLAAAFALLLRLGRNQWFVLDEWDLLATRRRGSPVGIWVPHNEHWSTIPILVFRALYHAVGMRSYLPYLAVLLALHVVLAHLLWRWMRRLGTGGWLATALTLVFLLLGAGSDDLLLAFQMSFVGSLLLGVVAVLLVDHDGGFGRRDLAAWLAAVAALMCSGVGVTMVVVTGVATLLRRGWRAAALVVSMPTLAYLAWFLRYGHERADTIPPSPAQLLLLSTYVWTGLTHSLEGMAGWSGAGPVLLLGLAALLLRHREVARWRAATAYAAATGAVVFFAIDAVGRIALGVDQAASSRYVYVACALLLVPVGLVLGRLGRGSVAIAGAVMVAVLAAAVQGAGVLVVAARQRAASDLPSRAQVLAAVRLLQAGAPILAGPAVRPEPRDAPDLTVAGLRQLVAEGAFGTVPEQPPESRLAAALQLQVVVGPTAAVHGGPAPRLWGAPAQGTGGTGCREFHGPGPVVLRLLFDGPAAVSVTPGTGGELTVAMATTADLARVSGPRTFPLTAGRTAVLSVGAGSAAPVVSLPPGDDRICGLQV
jgi:hypothetical protein